MKKTFTSDVQNMDQLQKKGSWKRFFHIIVAGNVPWLLLIPAFLFETLSAKLSVWFPVYQQKITGGDFSAKTIGLAVFFLIAYKLLFSNFWGAFNQYQWQIVPKNLKLVIYNKILSLPARFFDKYKSRELLSRITTDTEGMIYMLMFPTSVYGAVLAFYLMVKELFTYDNRLAWFLMAMVPVIAIIEIVSANIQYKYNIKGKTAESKLVGYLADILSNIPVVKTFVTEKKEKKKGLSFIDKLFKVNLKSYMWMALFGTLSQFTVLGIQIGSILIGAKLVTEGAIGLPVWITFYMFAQNSYYSITGLVQQYGSVKTAQGSMNFLSAVMATEAEKTDGDKVEKAGDIDFNNVTFAYDNKNVLDKVSFKIPYKKRVAIIGASGSGKTTTLSLLERLYTVNDGSITMNGKNINDFAVHDYRSHFSYVTQNFIIYSGTVKDNLKYGVRKDVSDQEVIDACKKANIHDFIMSLPDKYDTIIEEGAANLSGGERQRIAIANAFLCESEYLLLDEPTSNLDALSENLVCDAIENVSKNRTVISVAHRISTIMNYDLIMVMDKGKLIGQGTHKKLLDSCKEYKELVDTEFGRMGKVGAM